MRIIKKKNVFHTYTNSINFRLHILLYSFGVLLFFFLRRKKSNFTISYQDFTQASMVMKHDSSIFSCTKTWLTRKHVCVFCCIYLESTCKQVLFFITLFHSSTSLQMLWPNSHLSVYSAFLPADWTFPLLFAQVLLPTAKKPVVHLQRQL